MVGPSPKRSAAITNRFKACFSAAVAECNVRYKETQGHVLKRKSAREDAVAAIARVFLDHGYEGASISRLAEAASLGRSSLYNHFPEGKPDMAASVADLAADEFGRLVIAPLREQGSPAVRLGQAIAGLEQFYQGGANSCLIDHFSVPDAVEATPGAAHGMAEAALAGFETLAVSAGAKPASARARAERALVELQGGLIVSRALGRKSVFKNALARLPSILLDLPDPGR